MEGSFGDMSSCDGGYLPLTATFDSCGGMMAKGDFGAFGTIYLEGQFAEEETTLEWSSNGWGDGEDINFLYLRIDYEDDWIVSTTTRQDQNDEVVWEESWDSGCN